MKQRIIVAPSLLSADAAHLADEVRKVERAGADWIHVDVMDGHFVRNLTYGPRIVKSLRQVTKLPLDVHLMIENPHLFIPRFIEAGADYISIHIEASQDIDRDLKLIRDGGARPAIAVSPPTPVEKVYPFLDQLEFVLMMTVNPGFEAQAFIIDVLPKIRALRSEMERRRISIPIEVDGGVRSGTAEQAVKAGANIIVAGSAIYYAKDPAAVIKELKDIT